MFCAIAYVSMFLTRALPPIIPSLPFLQYDPKDVIITLGGFIFGPLASLLTSVVVSLIEAITVSDTGPIGLLMNVLSTCAFACIAALIYKKKRSFAGALIGLVAGCVVMTAVMLLWNYLITPLYMTYVTRAQIKDMLVPVFLPFNLIKSAINASFTFLLYKPIVSALSKSKKIMVVENKKKGKFGFYSAIFIAIIVASVVALLLWNNVI